MTAPFQTPADSVEVPRQVNLLQLEAEIRSAVDNPDLNFALTGPGDPSQPISAENHQQLWIQPVGSNLGTVAEIIAAHQIDPDWGIPAAVLAYQAAEAKVLTDPDTSLTTGESHALLVGLVLRNVTPASS